MNHSEPSFGGTSENSGTVLYCNSGGYKNNVESEGDEVDVRLPGTQWVSCIVSQHLP